MHESRGTKEWVFALYNLSCDYMNGEPTQGALDGAIRAWQSFGPTGSGICLGHPRMSVTSQVLRSADNSLMRLTKARTRWVDNNCKGPPMLRAKTRVDFVRAVRRDRRFCRSVERPGVWPAELAKKAWWLEIRHPVFGRGDDHACSRILMDGLARGPPCLPLFGLSMEVAANGRQSLPWSAWTGLRHDRHGHQRHCP